jgi:hypothetical protein
MRINNGLILINLNGHQSILLKAKFHRKLFGLKIKLAYIMDRFKWPIKFLLLKKNILFILKICFEDVVYNYISKKNKFLNNKLLIVLMILLKEE